MNSNYDVLKFIHGKGLPKKRAVKTKDAIFEEFPNSDSKIFFYFLHSFLSSYFKQSI